MKPKATIKFSVDIIMTIVLLIQMAYHLTGERPHGWIGAAMFVLFIVHHILNRSWIRNLRKGRYNALRIFQVCINLLMFLSMIGLVVSGVMMSRHVYGGQSFARTLHHLSAYWGFVLMSLHIGLHWGMIMGMVRKITKGASSPWGRRVFPAVGAIIAAYGAYAFVARQIPHYMFLRIQYTFFDYAEPAVLFFLDYLAIMGLFVFLAYYTAKLIQKYSKREKRHAER